LRPASQGSYKAKVFGGLNVSRVELEGSFQALSSFHNPPRSELRRSPVIPNFARLSVAQTFFEAADGFLVLALSKQLDPPLMCFRHG
jgi:hypothetical protein